MQGFRNIDDYPDLKEKWSYLSRQHQIAFLNMVSDTDYLYEGNKYFKNHIIDYDKIKKDRMNFPHDSVRAMEHYIKTTEMIVAIYFSKEENRKHFNELFAKAQQEAINQRLSKQK